MVHSMQHREDAYEYKRLYQTSSTKISLEKILFCHASCEYWNTPKNGMKDFINYDTKTEVNGRMVWAELYYNRELTQKELEDFEMVRG